MNSARRDETHAFDEDAIVVVLGREVSWINVVVECRVDGLQL